VYRSLCGAWTCPSTRAWRLPPRVHSPFRKQPVNRVGGLESDYIRLIVGIVIVLMADGGVVLAVGEAGGTIDNVPWRTPAAWKAVIRDGAVLEWQVFANNKPVYEILARRKPSWVSFPG
jgi:hypothetical protein